MLALFSLLSGIDIRYKTVERLYAHPEVEIAIHNLHILILKKKGVKNVDCSGDGTGYSLTIRKHYTSEAQKTKDKAKKLDGKKAFDNAMRMLEDIDMEIESIRLDRSYSFPSYVDRFGEAKVYVIPRKFRH